jgi:hypothetical protein
MFFFQVRVLIGAGIISLILETIENPSTGYINGIAILLAGKSHFSTVAWIFCNDLSETFSKWVCLMSTQSQL